MKTYLQLYSLVLMLMFLCVSGCVIVCCLLLLLILIIASIFFIYHKSRDYHGHLWRCSDHHAWLVRHLITGHFHLLILICRLLCFRNPKIG